MYFDIEKCNSNLYIAALWLYIYISQVNLAALKNISNKFYNKSYIKTLFLQSSMHLFLLFSIYSISCNIMVQNPISHHISYYYISMYICSELYRKAINKKIPNCIKIKFLLLFAAVSIFISEYINKMQFYCKPIWFEFFPIYCMWNILNVKIIVRLYIIQFRGSIGSSTLNMRGGNSLYIMSSIRFLSKA